MGGPTRAPSPIRPTPSGTGRRSPATVLSITLALVAGVWFAANFDHPRGPLVLLWIPAPVSAAVSATTCWRVSRIASLPGPTARFWRHFAIVAALVSAGAVSHAGDAIGGPAVRQHIGYRTLVLYGGAIVVILWAMYRLPSGGSGRGDRFRVWLDAGTVMLATGVFMWHYQTRLLLAGRTDRSSSLVASGIAMVLALVAVFAVAKVMLSGYLYVDKGSLRLLAAGLIVGSLGSLPQGLILDKPYLVCSQATIPAVMICATAAAQRQRRGAGSAGAVRPVPRRPFSVLPYLAVAAADGLLLVSAWRDDDQRVVAVVAVALTALVVVRQFTAFVDNGRLLARLDHSATHDALTDLPNRTLFADRLRAALATPRTGHPVSVALIDLDDFKSVNDTLGHAAGDTLLVTAAQRLVGCVRSQDTVARLGGDEFVVVLDGIEADDADRAVERILAALAAPVVTAGRELPVRASIGIAGGRYGDEVGELLRRADVAMYTAKNRGGNGYARFEIDPTGGPPPIGRYRERAV